MKNMNHDSNQDEILTNCDMVIQYIDTVNWTCHPQLSSSRTDISVEPSVLYAYMYSYMKPIYCRESLPVDFYLYFTYSTHCV